MSTKTPTELTPPSSPLSLLRAAEPFVLERSECPETLAHCPVVYVQPVAWGEMDAFNHLNNVAYYRYAESARIAYLYHLAMFKDDTLTILAGSSCDYLAPVHYPDTLLIGVRTTKIGNTSLAMSYEYYSRAQDKVVAKGTSVIVRTDEQGNKQAWDESERNKIATFEACEF